MEAWRRYDRCVETLAITDKDDLLNSAGQSGVDERAIQQSRLHDRNDDSFELRALRFVNRDRVGERDVLKICLGQLVLVVLERATYLPCTGCVLLALSSAPKNHSTANARSRYAGR